MRVFFLGYSAMGAAALEVLCARGDEVCAVVTHHDSPGEELWFETPAARAAALGLSDRVRYGEDLSRAALLELARSLAPDLILSAFYRRLLPAEVLETARLGAVNLHPSLLPRYRGRAPVNWVLVNQEPETGVTLHHMVARADAGDIVGQRAIPIGPRETALSLSRKVVVAGRALLEELLPRLAAGDAPRTPQRAEDATKLGRRRPRDGRVEWSWPAARIDALVRAVAPPWPGAFGPVTLLESAGEQRWARLEAGEVGTLPGAAPALAPGEARTEDGALVVGCGDGWYRATAWAWIEGPFGPLAASPRARS